MQKNPKKLLPKPPKLPRTKFSKVTGYKIDVKKSIVFIYTSNKHMEIEIKTIPFTITQIIKCLGINVVNYVQELYAEDYKMFMEDIFKRSK